MIDGYNIRYKSFDEVMTYIERDMTKEVKKYIKKKGAIKLIVNAEAEYSKLHGVINEVRAKE